MPFDEEEDDSSTQRKVSLKKVSSQKSIFEEMPKKQTQAEFDKKVQQVQDKKSANAQKAFELAGEFKKIINDRTLSKNKSPFAKELEKEVLTKLVFLAKEVNADPNEPEGEGNLGCIVLLMNTLFSQRDRINNLEYELSLLIQKINDTKNKENPQK